MSGPVASRSGGRSVARKLALQALYRWQLNDCPWQDLVSEFADAEGMARADAAYFSALVAGVTAADRFTGMLFEPESSNTAGLLPL